MSANLGNDNGEDKKQSKETEETSPDVVKVATETLRNSAISFQRTLESHKKAVAKEVSKFVKARKDLEDLVQKLGLDSFDETMDELCEIKVGGEIIATRASIWAKSPMMSTLLSAAKKESQQKPPELDLDPRIMRDIVEYLRWDDIRCLKSIALYTQTRYFGYLGLIHPLGHPLKDSSSIWVTAQERKHFRSWFKIEKLLYQGSRDGFTVSTFHSKCDNKGPTITLVTVGEEISNIHIFGGYNSASWNSGNSSYSAVKSCLFSLRSQRCDPCLILPQSPNGSNNVYNSSGHLPTFGGGHDLYLSNQCNTTQNSYSNLGHSYQVPSGTSGHDKHLLLAGSKNFKVNEVEVW
eukprot:CAMPEP_0184478388 /NCGR_PEP_ID=MMETSP0113_2-20130426/434_1 /TAXON_ID=91329 /ORGANISM="Norrisiella sphaerica, Strain BC52" /LENGTH=349 /DNA_ID=CAMNT_0026856163 /DNA_START=480 /DNA_END=1526 /DNA_ORIENTATION=-